GPSRWNWLGLLIDCRTVKANERMSSTIVTVLISNGGSVGIAMARCTVIDYIPMPGTVDHRRSITTGTSHRSTCCSASVITAELSARQKRGSQRPSNGTAESPTETHPGGSTVDRY